MRTVRFRSVNFRPVGTPRSMHRAAPPPRPAVRHEVSIFSIGHKLCELNIRFLGARGNKVRIDMNKVAAAFLQPFDIEVPGLFGDLRAAVSALIGYDESRCMIRSRALGPVMAEFDLRPTGMLPRAYPENPQSPAEKLGEVVEIKILDSAYFCISLRPADHIIDHREFDPVDLRARLEQVVHNLAQTAF